MINKYIKSKQIKESSYYPEENVCSKRMKILLNKMDQEIDDNYDKSLSDNQKNLVNLSCKDYKNILLSKNKQLEIIKKYENIFDNDKDCYRIFRYHTYMGKIFDAKDQTEAEIQGLTVTFEEECLKNKNNQQNNTSNKINCQEIISNIKIKLNNDLEKLEEKHKYYGNKYNYTYNDNNKDSHFYQDILVIIEDTGNNILSTLQKKEYMICKLELENLLGRLKQYKYKLNKNNIQIKKVI